MLAKIRSTLAAAAFAAATAAAPVAEAGPFTDMYVFGDSTVDAGNIFLATGGAFAAPPYFSGRFSNGPLWIDGLAAGLGLPSASVPSLGGGTNFAFGGARTGLSGTPPGLLSQVLGLWSPTTPAADPNALYVISAGANDMRDARSLFPGSTPADVAGRGFAAATAADNVITAIGAMQAKGARHFLLANLVDLGATPEAAALGLVDASRDATSQFNALLPGIEALVDSSGADLTILDLFGLVNAVRADAIGNAGGVFGITNIATPCGTFPGSIGASCDVSLFSDDLHPSARAGAIAAAAALTALAAVGAEPPAPVPAPASALLLLGALAAFSAGSRGRSGARSQATA